MFRDAVLDDLPDVVRLLADDVYGATREVEALPLDPRYLAGFAAMVAQGGRLLLTVDDGAIIGCLQLNILHGIAALGSCVAQIEGVRVASARRGKGVGRAMIGHAVGLARAAGCRTVQLTTRVERVDAQRFYEQIGFTRSHAGYKLAML